MPSTPDDRPPPEVQDIRELFARSGKRPTRRFDETTEAIKKQQPKPPAAEEPAVDEAAPEGDELPDGAVAQSTDVVDADTSDQSESSETPADSVDAEEPAPASTAGNGRAVPEPDVARSLQDQSVQEQRFVLEPSPVPADTERRADPSHPPPADEPVVRRSRPRVLLVATLLVVTFGLGAWVGQAVAKPEPATQPSPAVESSAPVAPSTVAPSTVVPQACLDTAKLGDQIIDLLVARQRGPRVDGVLQAYVTASQQCRAAASR